MADSAWAKSNLPSPTSFQRLTFFSHYLATIGTQLAGFLEHYIVRTHQMVSRSPQLQLNQLSHHFETQSTALSPPTSFVIVLQARTSDVRNGMGLVQQLHFALETK